jgi:hypothetical protein
MIVAGPDFVNVHGTHSGRLERLVRVRRWKNRRDENPKIICVNLRNLRTARPHHNFRNPPFAIAAPLSHECAFRHPEQNRPGGSTPRDEFR